MAVTLRYFTEFGKHTFQHITAASSCGGIYARVYCILYHVYDVVVKKVHVRYLISWWVSCIICYYSNHKLTANSVISAVIQLQYFTFLATKNLQPQWWVSARSDHQLPTNPQLTMAGHEPPLNSVNHSSMQLIICPIAIAYSMCQIIKLVCVCQCVSLSVCGHSHGRISWSGAFKPECNDLSQFRENTSGPSMLSKNLTS